MKFVSRAEWGARSASTSTNVTPDGVAVHWEGPAIGLPSHDRCAGLVRGIQAYHMDTNGWADIAYSAVACPHGYVFEGRGPGHRTAANGTNDANQRFYAVCFLGGEGDTFTDEAKDAVNDAIGWLGGGQVVGHRDLTETACPGDEIYAWVRNGHPRSTQPPTPIPPTPPKEPDVAKVAYPLTVQDGETRRLPILAIGGGFGWTRASVTFASAGVDVRRAVIGPNERPIAGLAPEGVETGRHFDGRGYVDLEAGDEWLQVELAPSTAGTLDLYVEASDG